LTSSLQADTDNGNTAALTVVAERIGRRRQIDKQFQQPIILRVSFPKLDVPRCFSSTYGILGTDLALTVL
jgi:hypothetical protein